MKLEDLMKSHEGVWANDIATVKQGAYFVQVAKKVDGKIELTDEGLRSFPHLGGRVVHTPVPEPVAEEPVVEEPTPEPSLDDDLAAALSDEAPKKHKKHGLK